MLSQKRIIVVQGSCFRILAAGRQPQQQADSRRAQHSQPLWTHCISHLYTSTCKNSRKKGQAVLRPPHLTDFGSILVILWFLYSTLCRCAGKR